MKMEESNGNILNGVIGDDLFPTVNHISDVKQVLEEMKMNAQALREPQIKALIMLQNLGSNIYLHGKDNPYKDIIKQIKSEFKIAVSNPDYYLDTIQELIPKPPKPVILAANGKVVGGGRR